MNAPARLYGLMASKANKAVILRRGPTNWFQLSLWHTDTDTFEHGQWFKGAIHMNRSDLSPDGSLFIYLASKHYKRRQDDTYGQTWTAVSRPPYFTALALWRTVGTYEGGIFLDENTVCLGRGNDSNAHPNHQPKKIRVEHSEEYLYSKRLQRDGWVYQPDKEFEALDKRYAQLVKWSRKSIRHKSNPNGSYQIVVRWIMNIKLEGHYTFAILNTTTQIETPIPDITWIDWDQRGRLIITKAGCLLSVDPQHPIENQTLLADFNSHQPTTGIIAPEWAKKW